MTQKQGTGNLETDGKLALPPIRQKIQARKANAPCFVSQAAPADLACQKPTIALSSRPVWGYTPRTRAVGQHAYIGARTQSLQGKGKRFAGNRHADDICRHSGNLLAENPRESDKEMVGAEGFEPPTLCSQSRCATRLRYAPNLPSIVTRHAPPGSLGNHGSALAQR